MAPIDVAQSLDNLKLERDAINLYDGLARIEKVPRRAEAFRTIAGVPVQIALTRCPAGWSAVTG